MRSTIWMFIAAGVLTTPAHAGESRDSDGDWCRDGSWGSRQARHCEVKDIALTPREAFQVNSRPNGGIRVHGWDKGEARLRVKVEAHAETEAEAKALAAQVRIETDGTIRATGPEKSREQNWYVSFRLDIPRQSDLRLEADNGGIGIEDVNGTMEFQTGNGGIHLKRVAGKLQGRTTNGGVHVELDGSEWEGEGLDVTTTNGGVHLELPEGYNARLETGTVNGRVHGGDLPVTGKRHGRTGGRIEADLGRGGRLLRLQTTNGGVHIGRD